MALLSVNNLAISFRSGRNRVRAVSGVDFSIHAGEMLALVGESGSGKTVTALSLLGLLPQPAAILESGQALFGESDLFQLTEKQWQDFRGNRISMIFQEPMTALNPVLTVGYQIAEVLRRHQNLKGIALRMRCLELIEQVGLPDPGQRMKDYPHQLSGGMRQRVMIAIALACQPQLLIADEPTTALDVTVQAQIMELLDRLRKETGTAILFITHNLALVSEYADRVAVMYAGQIVECAPNQTLFASPAHPYTRMLLRAMPQTVARGRQLATIEGTVSGAESACHFAARCPLAKPECREKSPPEILLEDGHFLRCYLAGERTPLPEAAALHGDAMAEMPQADAVLQVRSLRVSFPVKAGLFRRTVARVKAVDGVNLTLFPGETLALVGESGCGKTTVGKALIRLLPIDSGEIILAGQAIENLSAAQLRPLRRKIQMIFQDPFSSLNPRLMIGESLEEGMLLQKIGDTADERLALQKKLMRQVGLDEKMLTRYPHQFSGGQRQRIVLARALALEPEVIICDECTSALDVSVQAQMLNLLKEIQRQRQIAYLFITHDLSVVSYLADRVAVMYLGKIVEQGRMEEIFSSPAHPYTRALLAAAPRLDRNGVPKIHLEGDVPNPAAPPPGCPFHPRCSQARETCRQQSPLEVSLSPTHFCCCHYPKGRTNA
jgi:peptide/nickel transport system ATP-binding protein